MSHGALERSTATPPGGSVVRHGLRCALLGAALAALLLALALAFAPAGGAAGAPSH